LRVESITRNKCFVVTTRPNLPATRAWIDANLDSLIWQSIPLGIDPPASLLPCHLDKPVYTVTSQTYADILKKQFSLASNPTTMATAATKPPHKRQATIIDYDSDQSMESLILNVSAATQSSLTSQSKPTTPMNNTTDYAAELLSIKTKIASLQKTIATALEQIKNAIKSLTDTLHKPESTAMDTEDETTSDEHHCNQTQIKISSLISDLKHEIATFVIKTWALLQQKSPSMMNTNHLHSKT